MKCAVWSDGAEGEEMISARERQFMQHLRSGGWVKAIALPDSPKLIQNLVGKGWIECHQTENGIFYRITDQGLAAKMAPVRI
jgi:DNA-binding PadR family transcriptional regulator